MIVKTSCWFPCFMLGFQNSYKAQKFKVFLNTLGIWEAIQNYIIFVNHFVSYTIKTIAVNRQFRSPVLALEYEIIWWTLTSWMWCIQDAIFIMLSIAPNYNGIRNFRYQKPWKIIQKPKQASRYDKLKKETHSHVDGLHQSYKNNS